MHKATLKRFIIVKYGQHSMTEDKTKNSGCRFKTTILLSYLNYNLCNSYFFDLFLVFLHPFEGFKKPK